ncbi:MAG: SusC/RagA family TonB-linked outer membrane protein [Mucilaginibacter sp.]
MNRKLTYLKVLFTIAGVLLMAVVQAQTKKITGQVVAGDDHSPIPGVSITIKGTSNGTQTNIDGAFSLQAASNAILVFRTIGYDTQEVAVGDKTIINITLHAENKNLNEVLVVGYGTQTRTTTTSAVAKLDNQVLATAPRANVANALQGTVSGLQVISSSGAPGTTPSIILRGGASINNPSGPLVVVDGVVRSYQDIPEQDIASIDILKDAASTAIYGARANNGVILITTKHGKAGSSELTYKFTTGFNQQRQGYKYLNAGDYIYYTRLGGVNSGRTLAAINSSRGNGLLTDPANLATFDIQTETPANIGLLQQGWQDMDDPANPGNRIIFKDHGGEVANALFRNTQTEDHYINASGGDDKAKYYASFDYYNEPGTVLGASYHRYSGNFNGSYKVKPNIEVSSGVTFTTSSEYGSYGANNSNGNDANTFYRTLSLWPTFNPWLDAVHTQPNPGNGGITDGNPLYTIATNKGSNIVNRIAANASVKWDIVKGLSASFTGAGVLVTNENQSFQYAQQTYANVFATPQTYSSVARPASASYSRNFEQQYDLDLNYARSFGKHNFSLLVGAEYLDNISFSNIVSGTGAPTDLISTVNASTIFTAGGGNSSNDAENRLISTLARFNYDFDQKYLFTFVIREDGASQLAYAQRIGYFPGMSAGWNVQKENFFQNSALSKVISTLKPRVSYGSNGNLGGLGNYDVQGVYNTTTAYNGLGGISSGTPANPILKWETSSSIDAGLDLGLFHDRISLIAEYYNRKNSNLLTNIPLPSYLGYSALETNDGTYQNTGFEFTLRANIINHPNGLRLDFGATASFDKNKVLKLPNNGNENNRQGGLQIWNPKTGALQWVGGIQQGQPLGQVYAYKELGIFKDAAEVSAIAGNRVDQVANITGPNLAAGAGGHITPGDVNWQDVNGDGIINSQDQVYIGNIFPTWHGGFNFNAAYRNFSLYARFEYSGGNVIYNDFEARSMGQYQGTFNIISEIKNAWTPTNTNTMIPKDYYADQVVGSKQNYTRANNASNGAINGNNSYFYQSGNYLAGREFTLSYDFAKALLAKTHAFSKVRLYASGNNLFYIKKTNIPDPQAPSNGIYIGSYPVARTYVLGLQASF